MEKRSRANRNNLPGNNPILESRKDYKGFRLEDVVTRLDSLNILKSPSRILGKLRYPQGENK